jgi:membrane protein
MSHKKGFAKVLTMLMLVLTMFMAPFAQVAHAAPLYGWGSNGGGPSAANALAAYILGNGVAGRSSGARVSLDGLARLDNITGNNGGSDYAYGVNNNTNPLAPPRENGNASKAVTNIKTLYEHGYIQAFDNGEDVGAKQGTLALAPAALGASVFAMAFGLVQSVQQSIVNINPVNVFGLTDDSTSGVAGGMTPQYGADDGIFGGTVKKLFADAGVDANLIRAFAGLALTIMIALFVMALISGLRNVSQGKSAFSKAGQLGLRVLTILFATPFAVVLISGLSTLSGNTFQAAYQSLGTINDDLIVDSLQYAGLTNYDVSLLPNGGAGGSKDVAALNEALSKKAGGSNPNDIGIEKLVGYVSGNQTFTVNDYLSYLSDSSNEKVVGINKEFMVGMKYQILGYGAHYNSTLADRALNEIYDFSQNGADSNDEGNKDVKNRIAPYGKAKISDGENGDGSKTIYIETTGDGDKTEFISLPSDKLGSVTSVSLDNPRTYLYAANAAKDGSNEELNTNSYVWGGKSEQGSMAVHPWDGSKLTKLDSDKDEPFVANMVARAYINANAGESGNNFTNQSMVFLLQSKPEFNDKHDAVSMMYKAANTGGTPGSESASTGTNTYKFARYVIPRASKDDQSYLVGAYAKLNVTWVAAGWAALLGLLSLVTGVLISSIVKVFKGYIRAQFTGDFFGLLDMTIYLVGATGSFMMFAISVILGSIIVSFFTSFIAILTTGITGAASGVQSSVANIPFLSWAANGVSTIMTTILMGFLSLISVAILTYPIMKISVGGGESRTCNIVDLMITIPLSVAAMISDWLNAKKALFYGSDSGMPKMGESALGGGLQKDSMLGKVVGGATTGAVAGLTGAAVLGRGLAHAGGSSIKDGVTAARDAHKSGSSFGEAFSIGRSTAASVGASLAVSSAKHAVDTAKNFKPSGGNIAGSALKHFKDVSSEMKSNDRVNALKKAYNNFEFVGGDGINNSENAAEVALESGMEGLGANGALNAPTVPLDAVVDGGAVTQASAENLDNAHVGDEPETVQDVKKGNKKKPTSKRQAKKAAKQAKKAEEARAQEERITNQIAAKIEQNKAAAKAKPKAPAQPKQRVQTKIREDRKAKAQVKRFFKEKFVDHLPGKSAEERAAMANGMERKMARLEQRANRLNTKRNPKK